jgi:hypothetical protein
MRPDGTKVTVNLENIAKISGGLVLSMDTGEILTGCSVRTSNGAQLNPRLSAWLQGLPPIWDIAALAIAGVSRRSKRARKGELPGSADTEMRFAAQRQLLLSPPTSVQEEMDEEAA